MTLVELERPSPPPPAGMAQPVREPGPVGSAATGRATPQPGRDRTLDAMRGIFILSMTAGHLAGGTSLDRWAHPLVWVDGASGFVLFSGLVLGMQQQRLRRRSGEAAGRRWLVRRAAWIYAVHVCLTMVALAVRTVTGSPGFLPSMARFGGPLGTLAGVATLRIQPDFCNVLPLYVVLLLASVAIVGLIRRGHWLVCVALSAGLYVAAQVNPRVVFLADLSVGGSTWSWGAWQALFVVGMVTGWHWPAVRATAARYKPALLAVASLTCGVLVVVANLVASRVGVFGGRLPVVDALFGKYELRPGVPVYLGAAVVVTYVALRRLAATRLARPAVAFLATIGSRSLDCFIVLSLVQLGAFTVLPDSRPEVVDVALVAATATGYWLLATRHHAWRAVFGPGPAVAVVAESLVPIPS